MYTFANYVILTKSIIISNMSAMRGCTIFLLISLSLSSCISTVDSLSSMGIEKRRYSKGYHIDILKKSLDPVSNRSSLRTSDLNKAAENKRILHPSGTENGQSSQAHEADYSVIADDECADVITYKSGKRITVKVVDIDEEHITYKKCDDVNGANYVVRKSAVQSIKYADGDVDTFEDKRETSIAGAPKAKDYTPFAGGEPSNSGFATLSLIFGILTLLTLSLYFLYPLGLILGLIAFFSGLIGVITIKRSKGQKLGLMKAWIGLVAGFVTVATVLVLNTL